MKTYRFRTLRKLNNRSYDPAVSKLFKEAQLQKITLKEISIKAGLNKGALTHWRFRIIPNIINLRAALNVVGLDLKVIKI